MQTNTKDQVYAGFFVRLTAFLIDMIIVSVALAVIRVPMWFVSLNNPDNVLVRNFIFQYSIVDIVLLHRRNAWQKVIPASCGQHRGS